jgi:hypothetical protein
MWHLLLEWDLPVFLVLHAHFFAILQTLLAQWYNSQFEKLDS